MLGVFSLSDALDMADRKNVDLVLQSDTTDPPLCRLVEIGKYKYELEKKSKLSRQKQRAARVQQKELKMRPGTDVHDYQVRLRKAIEELNRGNHVKVVVQYRGREIQNREEGENIAKRFVNDVGDLAVIEKEAKMEGRNLTLTLAPNKS